MLRKRRKLCNRIIDVLCHIDICGWYQIVLHSFSFVFYTFYMVLATVIWSSMNFFFVQYIKRWNKMLNLFRNGSSWKSTVEMWFVSGCILPQTIFRYTSENTYGRKVLLHFLYEWSSHKIDLFHLIFSQAIRMWRMFEEIFTEINA